MPLCILFRLEAAKDDYRIHCEELEKQLIEVQHRNDELTSLAEESRALKDELDVLRFVCVWAGALQPVDWIECTLSADHKNKPSDRKKTTLTE